MILIAILYWSKKFNEISLTPGPSCLYYQEEITSLHKEKSTATITDSFKEIIKENNTPVYTKHVTELPTTIPVERMYLRVLVVLMEVLVLYFTYVKGQQY